VEQFSGVLFQMDPLNAHGLFSTGFLENIQVPVHGQGQIVLGNLVVFRQVRVKILFAGEHRPGLIRHPTANAARTNSSTAFLFSTGNTPGYPQHTGQIWLLAVSPNPVGHEQNILLLVLS
jgi:hypothetical protein